MQATSQQAHTGKHRLLHPLALPSVAPRQDSDEIIRVSNETTISRADGKFTDPREAISINKWPTSSHTSAAILPPVLSEARSQIHSFHHQYQRFKKQLLQLINLSQGLPPPLFSQHHDTQKENFDNFEL